MIYERKDAPLVDRKTFARRVFRNFFISSIVIAISLFLGILGYHFIGDLGWIDSLLNSSMILTGMGPVDKMATDSGKLFASFYALFSGIVFLGTIGIVLAPILHRFIHKFHLEGNE